MTTIKKIDFTPEQANQVIAYLISVGFTNPAPDVEMYINLACTIDSDRMGILDVEDLIKIRNIVNQPISDILESKQKIMTVQEAVEKYKDSIYTKKGQRSIKTIRALAKEMYPQIPSGDIFISETSDILYVYFEVCDLYGGGPEKEIRHIIGMLEYVKRKWFS